MNYENVPELNLAIIKKEKDSGRMSLEAMEWLVKRVERLERLENAVIKSLEEADERR